MSDEPACGDEPVVFWHKNKSGELSRGANRPAIKYKNGDVRYYINGLLHRTDGPAVEKANGNVRYYLAGKRIAPEEFWQKSKDFEPIFLKTVYYFCYYDKNNKLHNKLNVPAMISRSKRNLYYYVHGELHRTDGPAKIMNKKGKKKEEFYLKNKKHSKSAYWAAVEKLKRRENNDKK